MSQKQIKFHPSSIVFERKFDIALRKSHIRGLDERFTSHELNNDDKLLYRNFLHLINLHTFKDTINPDDIEFKTHINIYPYILNNLLNISDTFVLNSKKKSIEKIYELIKENIHLQSAWMGRNCQKELISDTHKNINIILSDISNHKSICKLLFGYEKFDEMLYLLPNNELTKGYNESVDEFIHRKSKLCTFVIKQLNLGICWSRNSAIIILNGEPHLLSKSYLLLIHNKLCDLLSILVYSSSVSTQIYNTFGLYEDTINMINCLKRLAIKYNQKYFSIVKVLEGLVIGEILIREEGIGNSLFLNTIIQGLSDIGFEYRGSELEDILKSCKAPLMHEFSCMTKLLGHPFIDVEASAQSLYNKTHLPSIIVPSSVLQCVRYAKLDFIENYILKYKVWPKVIISENAPLSLKNSILKNTYPNSQKHKQKYGPIQLSDYDYITLCKIKSFDYLENFIPYVKDRTISLLRNDVFVRYIDAKSDKKRDWKETRLLLLYLLFPSYKTDHLMYIQEYIAGNFEDILNYLVMRIVPKEKELKIDARGYGCKSAQERARTIVQECNTAYFLERYSQDEAMTLNELDLLKKLESFKNFSNAYTGYKQINVNVDASSWNNRFRHAATGPVGEAVLDKFFDTSIFSKTQLGYENTLLYVPDEGKTYWWDGQLGGIDGLNQYTWVHIYVNQIKVCMEEFPFPYHILCKGDDLRIAVMIPPAYLEHQSLDTIKNDLIKAIATKGAHFGHVIKVEDSYASECYFAFSKNSFVHKVEMPQTYRKIQKCHGSNNAFLTTIDEYISSSFSNAHSASKTSPTPIPCYSVALFWMYLQLTTCKLYKNLDFYKLLALSLVPNIMSGFPIVYLHNFFVRAESDLLPPFIDLFKYTKEINHHVFPYIENFFTVLIDDPRKSFLGFLSDPYSLPINKPQLPGSYLRQEVLSLIKSKTKNEKIQQLLDITESGYDEQLLDSLFSSNVFDGKLLGGVYDCSPTSIINSLIRKFDSGRSIYDAILIQSSKFRARKVLSKCMRLDNKLHELRVSTLNKSFNPEAICILPTLWNVMCSTEIAQSLRDNLWQRKVTSVTQPCIQHITNIGSIDYHGASEYAAKNHFEYFFDPIEYKNNIHPLFARGGHSAFLGSVTGSGLNQPITQLMRNNIMSEKIYRLLELYKWSEMTNTIDGTLLCSNLHTLIESMVVAYTGKPITDMAPFTFQRIKTRTVQHHVRSRQYKTKIVPNTLQNIYTYVQGNAYSHIGFEESPHHYRINFLHIYCYTVSIWAYNLWNGCMHHGIDRLWTVTSSCNVCMDPIIDIPIILTIFPPQINVLSITDIGEMALKDITEQLDEIPPVEYYIPDDPEELITYEDAQLCILQDFINRSWSLRSHMQDRFTDHRMTHTGLNTLAQWTGKKVDTINKSDMARWDIKTLFQDISLFVYDYIVSQFSRVNELNILSTLSVRPNEELPWTFMLKELGNCGLLYSLQSYLMNVYPQYKLSISDNANTYSPAFGACCYHYMRRNKVDSKLCIITNLVGNLEDTLKTRVNALRTHYIYDKFGKYYNEVYKNRQFNHNKSIILELELSLVLVSACMVDVKTATSHIKPRDGKLDRTVMYPCKIDDNYNDIADELLESRDEWTEQLNTLERLYSQINIHRYLEMIANNELLVVKVFREVSQIMNNIAITVIKTDVIVCQNKIKSEFKPSNRNRFINPEPAECVNIVYDTKYLYNINVSKSSYKTNTYIEPFNCEVPMTSEDTFLNRRWLERPFGANNISSSRILRLLENLKIDNLPDYSVYYCLGDGFGGYTSIISSLTKNSTIIFNTFPNKIGSDPTPILCDKIAELNSNTIQKQGIEYGHYDLALKTTWLFFEENYLPPTLITLDVEVPEFRKSSYKSILTNLAIYACRNMSFNSIIILKSYITYYNDIITFFGIISHLSFKHYMTTSPASALDGEIYIIVELQGVTKSIDYDYNLDVFPERKTIQNIRSFIDRYRQIVINDVDGVSELRVYKLPGILHSYLSNYIPLYGLSKLQEVTKVSLTVELQVRKHKLFYNWLRDVITMLNLNLTILTRELFRTNTNYLYDSLQHKLVITYRYIQLTGFLHVLNERSCISMPVILTQTKIISSFFSSIELLPLDNPFRQMLTKQYNDSLIISGKEIWLFKHFLIGVRWATGFLSYNEEYGNTSK